MTERAKVDDVAHGSPEAAAPQVGGVDAHGVDALLAGSPADVAARLAAQPGQVQEEALARAQQVLGNAATGAIVAAMPRHTSAKLEGMGQAFGADFSGVRIHHGDGVAEAHGAQALTQGEDIHFAANRNPSDPALLGHELAHVVQQRDGRVQGAQARSATVVDQAPLELEAEQAGIAAAGGGPMPATLVGRGHGTAERGAIQMFDSVGEHKAAGDDGSGGREYVWATDPTAKGKRKGTQIATEATSSLPTEQHARSDGQGFQYCDLKPQKFEFRLTHGDIVMLSGDLFDPRERDRQGGEVTDSLWDLASKPSSEPGKQVGTQDEIIYAIYKENPHDIRFTRTCSDEQPGGGVWQEYPYLFSGEVKKTVDTRYLQLASKNRDHFSRPDERERTRGGARSSNGGAFRGLHEDAIRMAYHAGRTGKDAGEAFAHEAAAEHFLTDAFSAGHVRTPRQSIVTYWDAKYPRFFASFLSVLESAITNGINDQAAGWVLPEAAIGYVVHDKVKKLLKGLPPVTLGDVLSKLTHDVDNEGGLWVTNDLKMHWKAYGDGHMYEQDKDNRTPELTRMAVSLGVDDLDTAQMLGTLDADQPERDDIALFAEVRQHTKGPAKPNLNAKYGAEQLIPFADPDRIKENGAQEWAATDFDDLWGVEIRTDARHAGQTYGVVITEAMQPGGSFYELLNGLGKDLDKTGAVNTHPRAAFYDAFLTPFSNAPQAWLKRIIAGAK